MFRLSTRLSQRIIGRFDVGSTDAKLRESPSPWDALESIGALWHVVTYWCAMPCKALQPRHKLAVYCLTNVSSETGKLHTGLATGSPVDIFDNAHHMSLPAWVWYQSEPCAFAAKCLLEHYFLWAMIFPGWSPDLLRPTSHRPKRAPGASCPPWWESGWTELRQPASQLTTWFLHILHSWCLYKWLWWVQVCEDLRHRFCSLRNLSTLNSSGWTSPVFHMCPAETRQTAWAFQGARPEIACKINQ